MMKVIPHMKNHLEEIIKEAGKLLLSYWHKGVSENKKEAGYYTQADIDSERFLKKALFDLFQADFIAEESGISGSRNNGYRWVIDPLDGTTNFTRHIPYFCISVALTHHDEPIVGAVYNPLQDEFFYAEKGKGATLNSRPIAVSEPMLFSNAVIGLGLSYNPQHRAALIGKAEIVGAKARAVRHFGAAALDLANVACGRLDGVIFSHLSWWDIAAGILLITEAGGIAQQFDGSALGPDFDDCMAGSQLVYDSLKQLIKSSVHS
jgi:myo-inositol-1(or 4)-monophosphatase